MIRHSYLQGSKWFVEDQRRPQARHACCVARRSLPNVALDEPQARNVSNSYFIPLGGYSLCSLCRLMQDQ